MMKKIFGKANMHVAGTTFENRQKSIWALRMAKKAFLTLQRDAKNENDPNAVKVLAHTTSKNGKKTVFCIGYVPKEKAEWVAHAIDNGKVCRIYRYKVVGGGKAFLGVEITIHHELYEVEVAEETAK